MTTEPRVTVYRYGDPFPCVLTHWGRQWKFRTDKPRRPWTLRLMHVWGCHSPINDGEHIVVRLDQTDGWHHFECYHSDGRPLRVGRQVAVPYGDESE